MAFHDAISSAARHSNAFTGIPLLGLIFLARSDNLKPSLFGTSYTDIGPSGSSTGVVCNIVRRSGNKTVPTKDR